MLSRKQSKKVNGTVPTFKLSSSFKVDRLEKGFDDRFEPIFNSLVQETLDFYADNMPVEHIIKGHTFTMSEDRYKQRMNDLVKKLHKGNRKHGEVPHRKFMLRVVHDASNEMKNSGYLVEHVPDQFIKITCIGGTEEDDEPGDQPVVDNVIPNAVNTLSVVPNVTNNSSKKELTTIPEEDLEVGDEADHLEEDPYFPSPEDNRHLNEENTLQTPKNVTPDELDLKMKTLKPTGIDLTK
uniref:Uncharacterized protein n=1 Tax=viral metagenome TaxID=1070528 RepID=A0A6C0ACI5_9ZZZZ